MLWANSYIEPSNTGWLSVYKLQVKHVQIAVHDVAFPVFFSIPELSYVGDALLRVELSSLAMRNAVKDLAGVGTAIVLVDYLCVDHLFLIVLLDEIRSDLRDRIEVFMGGFLVLVHNGGEELLLRLQLLCLVAGHLALLQAVIKHDVEVLCIVEDKIVEVFNEIVQERIER